MCAGTRVTGLKMLKYRDKESTISASTAPFLTSCPNGQAKISELLPVSDLCHGKIIVLSFKMLYNTTTCLCLTHTHLDCCNLLWRMHTALAVEVALNSCVNCFKQNSSFSTNYVKRKFYTFSSPRRPVTEHMFPVVQVSSWVQRHQIRK